MQPTDQTDLNQPEHESDDSIADEKQARRKALSRIGKYAAYAIPAVLALSHKPAHAYT
ncbi:hypothetical protein MCEGE14_01597 [Burkholderiaceae bacterium]